MSLPNDKYFKNLKEIIKTNSHYPFDNLMRMQSCEFGYGIYALRCDSETLEKIFAKHRSTKVSFKGVGNKKIYRYSLESTDFYRGDMGCYMHDIFGIIDKVNSYAISTFSQNFTQKPPKFNPTLSIYFIYSLYDLVKGEPFDELKYEFVLESVLLEDYSLVESAPMRTLSRLNYINTYSSLHHVYSVNFCVKF